MELTSLLGGFRAVFPTLFPPCREQCLETRTLAWNEAASFLPQPQSLLTVECLSGECWLTQQEEGRDVLLRSGQRHIWRGASAVVVQSLAAESRIVVRSERKDALHAR
jgi:hypothetical protein